MARRSLSGLRRGSFAAALAIVVGTLGAAPAAAASAPPTAPSDVTECEFDASSARVPAGRQGEDPNDLSRAQVASAEALLTEKIRQAGLAVISRLEDFRGLRVTVPVHLHVITRDDGSGAPAAWQVIRQMEVLNEAFAGRTSTATAPTIFRFAVGSVDVTRNSDWYDWSLEDNDDLEAKSALRRGGPADLNIYITGLQDGLLGYASYPFDGTPLVADGVVVLNESLPGGAAAPYNLGDTVTHEVGHWLGLLHTFENGCAHPGDGVPDTPYQHDGENIFFCNEYEDTCPAPGRDPVHNFMSYGDDLCMDRFTLGQSVRMGLAWFVFRGDQSQLGALLP